MRRSLAVLALLATSWPHVVVLECALGSALSAEEAGAVVHAGSTEQADRGDHGRARHGPRPHGTHHHGGGDAHQAPEPAGQRADARPDAPLGAQPCGMVMACGLVMMRAGGDLAEALVLGTRSEPAARASAMPLDVDLSADTPPPRPSA